MLCAPIHASETPRYLSQTHHSFSSYLHSRLTRSYVSQFYFLHHPKYINSPLSLACANKTSFLIVLEAFKFTDAEYNAVIDFCRSKFLTFKNSSKLFFTHFGTPEMSKNFYFKGSGRIKKWEEVAQQ